MTGSWITGNSGWSWVTDDGRLVPIAELSREELIRALTETLESARMQRESYRQISELRSFKFAVGKRR